MTPYVKTTIFTKRVTATEMIDILQGCSRCRTVVKKLFELCGKEKMSIMEAYTSFLPEEIEPDNYNQTFGRIDYAMVAEAVTMAFDYASAVRKFGAKKTAQYYKDGAEMESVAWKTYEYLSMAYIQDEEAYGVVYQILYDMSHGLFPLELESATLWENDRSDGYGKSLDLLKVEENKVK